MFVISSNLFRKKKKNTHYCFFRKTPPCIALLAATRLTNRVTSVANQIAAFAISIPVADIGASVPLVIIGSDNVIYTCGF